MVPKIVVDILELVPVAMDDHGVIHEQNILLKLSDGSKLIVFDSNLEYAKDVGSKNREVYLSVLFPDVKKVSSAKKGISSMNVNPTPSDYMLYGEVLEIREISGKQEGLVVDIGIGTIEVCLDRADYVYEKFSIGDYIKISGGRIDLEEIMD